MRVNGAVVSAPSWQVVLGGVEEVTVGGEPVKSLFHRLLIMHKPANCLSARPRKERKGGAAPGSEQAEAEAAVCSTVFDVVPAALAHPSLGPFGRLDKDTTGLILLGSDGGLQSLLTHPAGEVTKQYLATLRPGFPLAEDAVARIAAGLELADGTRCAPTAMEVVTAGPPMVVKLTLHEGVNHQVKRMIGQLGGFVDTLHRVAVGPLLLVPPTAVEGAVAGDGMLKVALAEGESRLATETELRALAGLLPKERGFAQLAEVQRAVTAERRAGKTTNDKAGAGLGHRNAKRRKIEDAEGGGGRGGGAGRGLHVGAVFYALRRVQGQLDPNMESAHGEGDVAGSGGGERAGGGGVFDEAEAAAVAGVEALLDGDSAYSPGRRGARCRRS